MAINNKRECVDHLGNKFKSETALLQHYNVAKTVYHRQLKNGIPLKDILTNHSRKNKVTDHNGKVFNTLYEMLEYHEVTESVYRYSIKNGEPLSVALSKTKRRAIDHQGNQFKDFKTMCEHWNISVNSVKKRMNNGWSLEQALTEPVHHPMTLPRYMKSTIVKKHIQIISLIDNIYFLCDFDGHDIIMSREKLLQHAKKLLEEDE